MTDTALIHPSAVVADGADVDPSVRIGPYSIIDAGAIIGPGCIIDSHVRIYGPTRMGANNRICHGATLGSEPQDLGFAPENTKPLTIGDHNHFKEYVNISCGVKAEGGTVVGNHNYLMVYAHLGHDCVVGDHNVIGNSAAISGHVEIDHHVFVSGLVGVHQFCRIGAYAMIGGVSGVRSDVPPFVMANGQNARFVGINVVGLRRNGFDAGQRSAIKRAYKQLYLSGLSQRQTLEALRDEPTPEVGAIVAFFDASRRGCISAEKEQR